MVPEWNYHLHKTLSLRAEQSRQAQQSTYINRFFAYETGFVHSNSEQGWSTNPIGFANQQLIPKNRFCRQIGKQQANNGQCDGRFESLRVKRQIGNDTPSQIVISTFHDHATQQEHHFDTTQSNLKHTPPIKKNRNQPTEYPDKSYGAMFHRQPFRVQRHAIRTSLPHRRTKPTVQKTSRRSTRQSKTNRKSEYVVSFLQFFIYHIFITVSRIPID